MRNIAAVLSDMKRSARARAMAQCDYCPLSPADVQKWVDFAVARVTAAHTEAAVAWAHRFCLEYSEILTATDLTNTEQLHFRERLDWWTMVRKLGKTDHGMYDAVGTRDRLRALARGDFDDEIDACLVIYGDEDRAKRIVASLDEAMSKFAMKKGAA